MKKTANKVLDALDVNLIGASVSRLVRLVCRLSGRSNFTIAYWLCIIWPLLVVSSMVLEMTTGIIASITHNAWYGFIPHSFVIGIYCIIAAFDYLMIRLFERQINAADDEAQVRALWYNYFRRWRFDRLLFIVGVLIGLLVLPGTVYNGDSSTPIILRLFGFSGRVIALWAALTIHPPGTSVFARAKAALQARLPRLAPVPTA